MPAMIAYDVLVQTIADWRAGVRPTAPSLPPIPAGAPEVVEEFDSGAVDFEDAQYGDAGESEYAAAEQDAGEVDFADDEDDNTEAADPQGEHQQYGQGEYGEAQQPMDSVSETYQDDDDEQY